MDGRETRKRIDEINVRVNELIGKFILTDEIQKLSQEKAALRLSCDHVFKNGKCIYCDYDLFTEGEKK